MVYVGFGWQLHHFYPGSICWPANLPKYLLLLIKFVVCYGYWNFNHHVHILYRSRKKFLLQKKAKIYLLVLVVKPEFLSLEGVNEYWIVDPEPLWVTKNQEVPCLSEASLGELEWWIHGLLDQKRMKAKPAKCLHFKVEEFVGQKSHRIWSR